MSEPKRLDLPTGVPSPRPDFCGGALLRLTRDDVLELRRLGVTFSAIDSFGDDKKIARVECNGFITVGAYRSALCPSCERLEQDMRATLRSRMPK